MYFTLVFVHFKVDIFQESFGWFMPWATDVVCDVLENFGFGIYKTANLFATNEDFIEVFEEVVWYFLLNLSDDNSGILVLW